MLVLGRRAGEAIVINTPTGDVRIVVLEDSSGRCRLGIDAPRNFQIIREELVGTNSPHNSIASKPAASD